jgi:Dolichyl-phosphate-mannose-protein mannosyltransferase
VKELSKGRIVFTVVVALIALGSCLRIFVCLAYNPLDFLSLLDPSRHWGNGLRFPKGAYFGASDPIGYQVYVFFLRKLTFDNRWLVGLASAALSVLMPWTYYRAGRNFGLRKLPALWAWALIVWTPSLIAIYHYIMMETLLLVVDGAALWATARYMRRRDGGAFLVAVVLWTLACLTKPSVIPLAAVCVVGSCWRNMPSLKTIATAAVLGIALLLPQAVRTEVALGFVAPFGNPWLTKIQHRSDVQVLQVNFYSHQNRFIKFKADPHYDMTFDTPSSHVRPLAPFSDWMIRRAATRSKKSITVNSEVGSQDWRNAYDSIDLTASEWLALWRENIVLFLFAPSYPETETADWVDRLELQTRWMWAPLVVFVIAGNLRGFTKRTFDLLPVAVTLFTLFLMLQNVVTFEGRYRKPLEPLLLLNVVWIVAEWRNSNGQQTFEVSQTRQA